MRKSNKTPPFNIGTVYRVSDYFDTTLSWQRGNTLMWGFSLHTNFNDLRQSHPEDVPPVYAPVYSEKGTNWQQVARELDDKAGYSDADIYADAHQVTIVADQDKYRDKNEATQRAATVLANHVPESVREYHIVRRSQRLPVESTAVDSKAFREVQTASIPFRAARTGQPPR